jgi:GNAT superfamily N-acetyltransferase
MTEATGGITMTLPNDYVIDSVGNALPGIELRLSEEGELLLKGPYISEYYYDDPMVSTFQDGWFHTGDIFTEENGHYFIQDRKKEIYKNATGETITPQKIENMLQEFDAIESAFLVGDRMDFNTVLIYPNSEYLDAHFPERNPDNIRSSIGALIQSINGFLSRYERIVNFAIIPRNFTIENDELTQKGTYKRKNILDRWSDIIQPMYSATQTELDSKGKRISFPNWFFKKLKISPQDISWSGRYLKIMSLNIRCKCTWHNDSLCLGNFIYKVDCDNLNIEHILLDPRLWVGNQQLVEFSGNIVFQLIHFKKSNIITVSGRTNTTSIKQPVAADSIPSLRTLHTGTLFLEEQNLSGFDLFNALFENGDIEIRKICTDVLVSMIQDRDLRFSQKIFNFLIPYLGGTVFLINLKMLFNKLRKAKKLKTWDIDKSKLKDIHVKEILLELVSIRKQNKIDDSAYQYLEMLFQLSANILQIHPKYFSFIRHELTNWVLHSSYGELIKSAESSLNLLNSHLKRLIPKRETDMQEWKKLIQFEKSIEIDKQTYLINLFQKQSIIFETIFILSGGRHINLDEIENEGIWISQLYKEDDYIKYRVLLTLQDGIAFNFIISHLLNFNKKEMKNLSHWQISMSSGIDNSNLTNNFIACFPDQRTIISEYDHGSDIYWYLKSREDEINNKKLRDRWDMRWLHFGWSSLQGYIDYLMKTDFNYALKYPSIKNVIVSQFDNATHVRIKQSFKTEKVNTLLKSLIKLYENIIISTENQFQGLNHVLKWEVVFTCILQTAGTTYGLLILEKIKRELKNNEVYGLNTKIIQEYIEDVTAYGYLPKPVVFAALRFQRWMDLNKHATIQAQGEILQELYKDYKLHELYEQYPAIRFRFYLLTCFLDHESDVAKELLRLSSRLSNSTIENEELETRIHVLINNPNCSENNAYFLTRLIYHHVEPSDYAELILHDTGMQKPDLVVIIKDKKNKQFTIRPAYKPKELALFHDLLLSFNLHANFTEDHKFLLMFSPGNKQCGGIYWKIIDEKTAHLEKISIDEKYQGNGLGERLLNECLHRLKKNNIQHVTVAFMKSVFFKYHGFKTDANFAGLVKKL